MRLLDGAQVIVPPVPGSEEAAAAQPGHGQAMRVDGFHSFLQTHLRDLIAPGRDAADARPGAAIDRLSERPLLLRGGRIEGEHALHAGRGCSLTRLTSCVGFTKRSAISNQTSVTAM